MKYTPGPWEVEAVKSVKGPMQVESIDFYAVTSEHAITKLKTVADLVDNPADAHLIAAAPELLEALEHIVEYWNRDQNEDAMADALWHIIVVAMEAIAKAKGGK